MRLPTNHALPRQHRRIKHFWRSLLTVLLFACAGLSIAADSAKPELNLDAFGDSLPGIEQFERDLLQHFAQQRLKRGPKYMPRTRHLRPDDGQVLDQAVMLDQLTGDATIHE